MKRLPPRKTLRPAVPRLPYPEMPPAHEVEEPTPAEAASPKLRFARMMVCEAVKQQEKTLRRFRPTPTS